MWSVKKGDWHDDVVDTRFRLIASYSFIFEHIVDRILYWSVCIVQPNDVNIVAKCICICENDFSAMMVFAHVCIISNRLNFMVTENVHMLGI